MIRRYHHSPSIPFLISSSLFSGPLSGLKSFAAPSGPSAPQNASTGLPIASRKLLAGILSGGLVALAGIGVEVTGEPLVGNALYGIGILVSAVAVIFHPESKG